MVLLFIPESKSANTQTLNYSPNFRSKTTRCVFVVDGINFLCFLTIGSGWAWEPGGAKRSHVHEPDTMGVAAMEEESVMPVVPKFGMNFEEKLMNIGRFGLNKEDLDEDRLKIEDDDF